MNCVHALRVVVFFRLRTGWFAFRVTLQRPRQSCNFPYDNEATLNDMSKCMINSQELIIQSEPNTAQQTRVQITYSNRLDHWLMLVMLPPPPVHLCISPFLVSVCEQICRSGDFVSLIKFTRHISGELIKLVDSDPKLRVCVWLIRKFSNYSFYDYFNRFLNDALQVSK